MFSEKRRKLVSLSMTAGFVLVLATTSLAMNFPLRAKYADLPTIETAELASVYDDCIIVDARNRMEFNVVHMKGAKNLLVGKMKETDLTSLRGKSGGKLLVFYCNGTTCSKSYKAGAKAKKWGFSNFKVYDAGIFHWAISNPEKADFFGKPLSSETVKTSLIPKDKLQGVTLPTSDFLSKAKSGNYTVIDIRDKNERSETPIRLAKMKVLSFDTLVKLLEKKSKAVPRSGLLIFDNVGKQVKWVQYYLEEQGVDDYFFLKGGIKQWKKDGYDSKGAK